MFNLKLASGFMLGTREDYKRILYFVLCGPTRFGNQVRPRISNYEKAQRSVAARSEMGARSQILHDGKTEDMLLKLTTGVQVHSAEVSRGGSPTRIAVTANGVGKWFHELDGRKCPCDVDS